MLASTWRVSASIAALDQLAVGPHADLAREHHEVTRPHRR